MVATSRRVPAFLSAIPSAVNVLEATRRVGGERSGGHCDGRGLHPSPARSDQSCRCTLDTTPGMDAFFFFLGMMSLSALAETAGFVLLVRVFWCGQMRAPIHACQGILTNPFRKDSRTLHFSLELVEQSTQQILQ